MEKKYELIESGKEGLYRIKALRDFCNDVTKIKKGDIGGYVASEHNLSHEGECWIFDDAMVYDKAQVSGNAYVCGNAEVFGKAQVYGNIKVCGNAEIYGNAKVKGMADYMFFQNTWSSGRYFTWTRSNNMWKVGCFHGTGEQLIAKAYEDSEISGKCYEAIVQAQNRISELLK
jgi:hypothetical protein